MTETMGYTQALADILNSQLGQSITQAFTAGEEQERERIIKLLETYVGLTGMFGLEREALIALIKGETK